MPKSLLWSTQKALLKECNLTPRNKSMNSIITFEPLQNLHLGVFELAKEFIAPRLFSDSLKAMAENSKASRNSSKYTRNGLLKAYNLKFLDIKKEYHAPKLHVSFSKLNGPRHSSTD